MGNIQRMEVLRQRLNSLDVAAQAEFARRVGTTIGYLRKAMSKGQRLGESIVIGIERETAGAIRCEALRPDVDWAVLRNSSPAAHPIRSRKRGIKSTSNRGASTTDL